MSAVEFIRGAPPAPSNAPQERPGRIEYLYLNDDQKIAVANMNEAIDNLPSQVRLRCQNPEVRVVHDKPVLYFPHTDYDERTPPTEREADLMCKTRGIACPLAELCRTLGESIEAPVGVWGGRVFVDGEDYYNHGEDSNG